MLDNILQTSKNYGFFKIMRSFVNGFRNYDSFKIFSKIVLEFLKKKKNIVILKILNISRNSKGRLKKISNFGFLILSEIIALIFQSTFCEKSTWRWIWSRLGIIFVVKRITPFQISCSKANLEFSFFTSSKTTSGKRGNIPTDYYLSDLSI